MMNYLGHDFKLSEDINSITWKCDCKFIIFFFKKGDMGIKDYFYLRCIYLSDFNFKDYDKIRNFEISKIEILLDKLKMVSHDEIIVRFLMEE